MRDINNEKKNIYIIISGIFCSIILIPVIQDVNANEFALELYNCNVLKSANISNREIIDEILDSKINQFLNQGYFSTVHKASLRDTYYGVYSLYAIGMENQLNESKILEYVSSCFDDNIKLFSDCYSIQYLNTYEFETDSFALTSILQINCFTILTLKLLERLDLIDVQATIDFLWSCYNPVSSGFIGQPYNSSLHTQFKVSTLDNTYYAVETLDMLMTSWNGHITEKNDIIEFVNGLQYLNSGSVYNGIFRNEDNVLFDSIIPLDDENLLSSYYAIKILEVFGYEGSIDINAFHEYLDAIINVQNNYFDFFPFPSLTGQSNILASAIGVEISDLTGYQRYDKSSTIQYILENRNFLGCWDDGIDEPYTQLVHTYQILRSLSNLNLIGLFNSQEKDEISEGIFQFFDESSSFTISSKQHVLMGTFNLIISSLSINDRIGELGLGIDNIYDSLMRMLCRYSDYFQYSTNYPINTRGFHLYNIESNFQGEKGKIESLLSIKNTYQALSCLNLLFKLDDLDNIISLDRFVQVILNCQFILDQTSSVYGGFFPHDGCQAYPENIIDNYVLLDQSYYAIKTLELIYEYRGYGTIQTSGINYKALSSYLMEGFIDVEGEQYFDMGYGCSIDDTLKNTYFALNILMDMDLYSLDDQKIWNFIISNIDYSSIKNIYYSFKIVELLGLNSPFDMTQTKNLVQNIFNADLKEFYLTTNKKKIDQDILYWITEMGNSKIVTIVPSLDTSISLGNSMTISAEIRKMVYSGTSPYMTVKFESNQVGVHTFEIVGSNYTVDVPIPIEASNYPVIIGKISVYEAGAKIGEINVSFATSYDTNHIIDEKLLLDGSIDFYCFSQLITGGIMFPSGLYGFEVYIKVYRNQEFIERIYLNPSGTKYIDHTEFELNYSPIWEGSYEFKMYMKDGIVNVEKLISEFFHLHYRLSSLDRYKDHESQIVMAIGLSMSLFGVPCAVVALGSKSKGFGKKIGRK